MDKEKATNSRDQDRIWEYYQNINPESFEGAKPRLDYIIRAISRNKKISIPRVLNIGAGSGYLEETMKNMGWKIFCLDPDLKTIQRLVDIGIQGQQGYIEKMPFETSSFDFVVASEVLEHLDDDQRVIGIKEIHRVLGHHGIFIGTVPYFEKLDQGFVVCPKCGEYFHRWGHKKSFKIDTLMNELSPYFKIVRAKKKAFVPFTGKGVAGFMEAIVREIMAFCGVRISSTNIYFTASK